MSKPFVMKKVKISLKSHKWLHCAVGRTGTSMELSVATKDPAGCRFDEIVSVGPKLNDDARGFPALGDRLLDEDM